MSEKKWPDGPYTFDSDEGAVLAADGQLIVDVDHGWFAGTEEYDAFGNLFAAAPDLYEVAERLLEANRTATNDLDFISKIALVCEVARAALARARGEA